MFNPFNKNPNKLSTVIFDLEIKDNDVIYQDYMGHRFRVNADDIETVTANSAGGFMKAEQSLQLIGRGAVLAEVIMPGRTAEKARKFIQERLAARKNGQA